MLARFYTFARPYLPTYAVGVVLLLLTNGLSLWIPWLLRGSINAIEQRLGLSAVAGFAGAMIGVALLQAVVRTVSRWTMLGNSRRIVYDLRNKFFAHLQRLGPSYYDRQRTGDIMSRGVNDIQILQGFYGPGVLNLFNTAIVYVAVVILLLRLDPRLTVISLMLYPVLMLVINRLSGRVYALSIAVQQQLGEISNRAQENISGIQQVKTYVQEEREISAFAELCAEFRRRNLAMAAVRGGMLSLIGVVTGVGTLIVLFMGGRSVIEGRMSLGDFVAFNAYLGLLVWPTIALGWIINTFQRGAGAMRRLYEVLDAEPDRVAPAEADSPRIDEPIEGNIEIRGLTFRYGEDDGSVPALHDIHLRIPQGGRVALVGPVGSGKTTLANLLVRLYPVPSGTVFVGGRDITELSVDRLRRNIGYVPQEAFLFSRSIRDNVAFRDPGIPEVEVARAIEVSHLGPDLDVLPEGLDTVVGERGFTLSGGQRQRATLARAILGGPRILLLDDSLSSVDADTERAILNQLEGLMEGRTLILITHRPSTLVGVQQIVVLDRGRVVEQGTHEELLAAEGLYSRLFQRQKLEEWMGSQ